MLNAIKSNLFYPSPNSPDKNEARTPAGVHLIWICVEDEGKDWWELKDCFAMLIGKHRMDPNIKDDLGETLLNYAIKNDKEKSIDILLEQGRVDVNLADKQGMTAIGQALIKKKIDLIDKLLDKGADIHRPAVYDPFVSPKLMTPLAYFIKRMRTGQIDPNKDKKLIELLKRKEIKATEKDERIGLHR